MQEIGEIVASSKDGVFRELSVVQHAGGRGESSNAMLYLLLLVLAFFLNMLVDGCVWAERSVPEKLPLNAGAPRANASGSRDQRGASSSSVCATGVCRRQSGERLCNLS